MDLSNYKLPELNKEKTSERAEAIRPFVGRVRNFKGELSAQRIAILLAPYSTADLYDLYKKCDSAENFSKVFWWHLK